MPFDGHSSVTGRTGAGGFGGAGLSDLQPRKARLRGSVVLIAVAVAVALCAWIWKGSDAPSAAAAGEWVQSLFASEAAEPAAEPGVLFALPLGLEPATTVAPEPAAAEPPNTVSSSRVEEPEAAAAAREAGGDEADPAELKRQARVTEAMEQGQLYTRIGRYRQAADQFAAVVALDPDNALARYRLGLVCVRSGRFDAARRQMTALEELDPDLANLLGNLVR